MSQKINNDFYALAEKIETKSLFKNDSVILPNRSEYAIKVKTDEGEKIVNFCSKNYQLVKNNEIFPRIEDTLSRHFIFQKKYRHVNHSIFWADYAIEGSDFTVGNSRDVVKPVIRILHSYDGSVSFRAKMGFYRQICSNGLWGYKYDTDINLKHSIGNFDKIMNDTIKGLDDFIKNAKNYIGSFDELAKHRIPDPERYIELLVNSTRFPSRQMQAVIERAYTEQQTHDLEMSKWLIYNAFNYQLNHNKDFTNDELYRMQIDAQLLQLTLNGVEKENKLVLV